MLGGADNANGELPSYITGANKAEGFLIVTSAADKGLVDIHDRRPLALTPETARVWMRQFLEPHSKSITYRVIPALTRPMMRKDTNPYQ